MKELHEKNPNTKSINKLERERGVHREREREREAVKSKSISQVSTFSKAKGRKAVFELASTRQDL